MASSKKSFPEFQSLLRSAVETSGFKTLKAFAEKAGLAEAHLNRMLNNAEISRPTTETLKKILSVSPDISPLALFESCGYDKKACLQTVRSLRSNLDEIDHIHEVENDIRSAGLALVQAQRFYENLDDVAKAILDAVPEMVRIRITRTVPKSTSRGESALCCSGIWEMEESYDTYLEATTLFALYVVPTPTDNYLVTNIRMDGATLNSLGFIPDWIAESQSEEDEDVESIPVTTTLKEKERKHPEFWDNLLKAVYGSNIDPDNYSALYRWETGIGTYCDTLPKNFKQYVLSNKKLFIKTDRDKEIIEVLKEIPDADLLGIKNLFSEYDQSILDEPVTPGWIDVLLNILRKKYGKKDLPGDILYSYPVALPEIFRPALYVEQDFYFTCGTLDTKVEEKISDFLVDEFKKAGFEFFGTVQVYNKYSLSNSEITSLPSIDEYVPPTKRQEAED